MYPAFVALLLLFIAAGPCSRAAAQIGTPILTYTESQTSYIFSSDAENWAVYLQNVCGMIGSQTVSGELYRSLLQLDIETDFFYKTGVPLYASGLGFLTITSSPMCSGFCADRIYDTLYGYYQFTTDRSKLETLGGDWPVIGLYITPLTMSTTRGSQVCVSPVMEEMSPDGQIVAFQVVEYNNMIPAYGSEELTAQIVVYTNGTIIFRYQEIPDMSLLPLSQNTLSPSVGLVLSKRQRVVASTPIRTSVQRYVAMRFDPVRDKCAAYTTSASCFAAGDNCGWCGPTSTCINAVVSDDQCPRGFFEATAGATPATPARAYTVSVTPNSCPDMPTSTATSIVNGQSSVRLGFRLPFFGQGASSAGPTAAPASATIINPIRIGAYGVDNTAALGCNPLWGYCVNGNYTNSIVPFATALAPSPTDQAQQVFTNNGSFIHLRGAPGVPQASVITASSYYDYPTFLYDLVLSRDGTIDIYYGCFEDFGVVSPVVPLDYFTYPPATIGLLRDAVDDPASIIIPPLLIRSGTRVSFKLVTQCPPCGEHGQCDETSGTCTCTDGFIGTMCEECAPGRGGPGCRECPQCLNGGTCNAGLAGSATCLCPAPYSGPFCEVSCTAAGNGGGGSTSRCSPICGRAGHGHCMCGQCVCEDGYTGADCNTPPSDPCVQYSLDGCPGCSAVNPQCAFCFDSVCFDPALSGSVVGYACSYAPSPKFTQVCHTVPQPIIIAPDFGFVLLGVLIGVSVLALIAACALMCCMCGTIRENREDIHMTVAAAGIVDYNPARRERKVVHGQFIYSEQAKKMPRVLGFVLNQISLRKLYKRQHGKSSGSDGSNRGGNNGSSGD